MGGSPTTPLLSVFEHSFFGFQISFGFRHSFFVLPTHTVDIPGGNTEDTDLQSTNPSRTSSMKPLSLAAAILVTISLCIQAHSAENKKPPRPNIIIVLVDDMGYSDIGCYGGEIDTPNLDRLASKGLRFTQFYNAGRCCPTRASLLTGRHPHQVGIGHMTAPPKKPLANWQDQSTAPSIFLRPPQS